MTIPTLPNASESLAPLVAGGRIPMIRVWGMLALRSVLTFALLLALATALATAGRTGVVAASAAWWLWFVTAANVICIYLMARFGRNEGLRLRDIYFASRSTWKDDVVWALGAFAVIAIVVFLPSALLATVLWGDAAYPNRMLIQPLPPVAVYPLFLFFPVTQALAELPIYWGYVAPRLQAAGKNRWLVITIVGAVLSLQHMFFSFQLDVRYDLWLAIKFLPFALWTGFVVNRRPTTLPYLMGMHFALDALIPLLVLLVSKGLPLP